MTLDDILNSVQPVSASDIEVAAYQLELELDRLRRRVERAVTRGDDPSRALRNLHNHEKWKGSR